MVKLGTLLGKRLNFGTWVLKGGGVVVVDGVTRAACMLAAAAAAVASSGGGDGGEREGESRGLVRGLGFERE